MILIAEFKEINHAFGADFGNVAVVDMGKDAIRYTEQNLTEEQKAQARENICAVGTEDVKNEISKAKEVFIAEYGVTTFAEMDEAYNTGKVLFCKEGRNLTPLYQVTSDGSYAFYRINAKELTNIYRTQKQWGKAVSKLCASTLEDFESRITALEERITELENANSGGGDTITFYVNGEEFTAEAGMTWEEFVYSDYNPTFRHEDCCNEEKHHFDCGYNKEDDVYYTYSCCGPIEGIIFGDNGWMTKYEEIQSGGEYHTSNDF